MKTEIFLIIHGFNDSVDAFKKNTWRLLVMIKTKLFLTVPGKSRSVRRKINHLSRVWAGALRWICRCDKVQRRKLKRIELCGLREKSFLRQEQPLCTGASKKPTSLDAGFSKAVVNCVMRKNPAPARWCNSNIFFSTPHDAHRKVINSKPTGNL